MPDKLTPEWELYEYDDEQEGTVDAPPKELETTPDVNDNYVNVEIMLPRGSEMLKGWVTGRKHDIDGNTARKASDNTISSMREYTVHFEEVNWLNWLQI